MLEEIKKFEETADDALSKPYKDMAKNADEAFKQVESHLKGAVDGNKLTTGVAEDIKKARKQAEEDAKRANLSNK